MGNADDVYRSVLCAEPPAADDDVDRARHAHLYEELWPDPALGRRERRWVTLACVAFGTDPAAMDSHVYAALASGDITLTEMLEFVLHFAVYSGWPKASRLEGVLREQWARWRTERGEPVETWPLLANEGLGDNDWEQRLQRGEQEFRDVNLVPAPARNTPYQQAGILSFVFGHLWMRPGLTRRDRRFVTVPCVALSRAPMPILSHVGSALYSGDVTRAEMDAIVAQVSAYAEPAVADQLRAAVVDDAFGRMRTP